MSIFEGTRQWVYAKTVGGRFQQLHRWSGRVLIGALLAWEDSRRALFLLLPIYQATN